MQTGFDDANSLVQGATYLIDPTLLMAAPDDPRDGELCTAFLDLKVPHACRNEQGEMAPTAVGITVAFIDKLGCGQPRITTEDDRTPQPTPPRRTTRLLSETASTPSVRASQCHLTRRACGGTTRSR